MPKIHFQELSQTQKNIENQIGLPLFNISIWEEDINYMEDRSETAKDFDVYAGDSLVSIVFSLNEIKLKVINGSIVFGFDKDNFLCFIQMNGMKLNEKGFLEEFNK